MGGVGRSCLASCLLLLTVCLRASSAFLLTPSGSHNRQHELILAAERGHSRAELFQAVGGVLGSAFLLTSGAPAEAVGPAGGSTEYRASFSEALSTVLISKKIIGPVKRYIEVGQYDPARTNVNYCTKNLRLRKAMQSALNSALDFQELDMVKFDAAADAVAVYDNQLSQLDSAIYTLIFIPTEGESISPQAVKFQKMAFEFYDVVMDGIDKVLALANEQDLKEAERIGAKVQLPPFLFKDFSGDFYRPATP